MNYVAGNDDSAIAPTQEHDRPREQRRKKRRKAMSIETRRPAKEEDNVSQKEDSNATIRPAKKRKRNQAVLEGMIVAVSTLDVKGESHSNSESSYKAVAECCRKLGASVTGQLHRRVSYLICNETAVNNATQRVRKAVKKKVPLVDVAWIRKCQENEELVDLDPYRLDNLAVEVIKSKSKETTEQLKEEGEVGCDEVLPDAKGAWTEPISYGCCCVCHENGDKNCPWCPDCS